jgi:hypothetical protein
VGKLGVCVYVYICIYIYICVCVYVARERKTLSHHLFHVNSLMRA